MTDDTSLLQRYAFENAEDAFRELVRRHVDGVYSAALRRSGGNRGLAEDVTQKVFVALARKARTLTRHPYLTAWLHTVTRLETISALRAEGRRRGREQEAYAMQEMMSDGEGMVEWSRLAPVLDSAIDSLKEADRAAVLLRFVDQRGFAEIGAALGISEDAARMRVNRALENLRIVLTRRGIPSTSAALGFALAGNAVIAAPVELAGTAAAAALAVGGVGTGVTAAALGFMSTTKFMAAAAGLAVLAVGTATWQVGEARAARRESADSRSQTAIAERQLHEAESRVSAIEEKAAALRRSAEVTSRAQHVAVLPSLAWASRTTEEKKALGKAFMDRHPELAEAGKEMARAAVSDELQGYIVARKLTELQARELVSFMRRSAMPSEMTMPTLGPVIVELAPAEKGPRPAWINAEELQYLNQYVTGSRARHLVQSVARQVCFTDTPLTPDQAAHLFRAAEAKPPAGSNVDWAAVFSASQSALPPQQLQALRALELGDQYSIAFRDAKKAAKAPTANARTNSTQ